MAGETIFSKIIRGEIPADVVHRDDLCIAFRDINPQAPVHILIIPKVEIESCAHLRGEHQDLVGHLILTAGVIARQEGLGDNGYRLVFNIGRDGGMTVPHLHLHLLGGRQLIWPPG